MSTLYHFDVSSVFNQDVIVNNGNGGTDTTQTAIDRVGSAFITQSYASVVGGTNGNGLPDNGSFAANSLNPGTQLRYRNTDNGNNARLTSAATDSFSFAVPQKTYSAIHIAATSTEAASNIRVTFNYADGTSETTSSQQVPDWYSNITETKSLYYLIDRMDRSQANSTGFANENNPAVFGLRFAPNSTKVLQSITVTKENSAGWLVFF